jgi:hypothetical protein
MGLRSARALAGRVEYDTAAVRRPNLDATSAQPLAGTEGASYPFWLLRRCLENKINASHFRSTLSVKHYVHGEDESDKGWYRTEKRGIDYPDVWRPRSETCIC